MRNLFEKLRNGGEKAVEELVRQGVHEKVELEFKTKSDPSHGRYSNDDKKNLAKELSAFSNSMGGLLVWGVVAKKDANDIDRALATARISDIDRFRSDTLTLVGELIAPRNEDVHVEAVHAADGSGAGYLLVYVGRSERRPHRGEAKGQKQYFKRSGDSTYAMEHFDIEDAFGRVSTPELSIHWELEPYLDGPQVWSWDLVLYLANGSRKSARFPYLNLRNLRGGTIDQLRGLPLKLVDQWNTFAGGANQVIHPEQKFLMTSIRFDLVLRSDNEWQRKIRDPIAFDYQFGALDCRMRDGTKTIKGAEIDDALIRVGVDIANM